MCVKLKFSAKVQKYNKSEIDLNEKASDALRTRGSKLF